MNDLSAAYHARFSAPRPSPVPVASPFWRNVRAIEYHIKPRTPLYEYLTAKRAPNAPIFCRQKIKLDNGDLLAQFTKAQLERAIAHIYGINQ